MKKITFMLIALCLTNFTFSQCINKTEYSGTAPTSTNEGFVQDIAFGIEAGECVTIGSLIIGDDYEFTSNRTAIANADYITIIDESNTVIAHGLTPLTINATTVSIVRMHINLDAACNTDADFHDATIQSLTNAPTCYKPENPGITFKSDTKIDFFWSPPSMSIPSGYDWEIVPSGNAQGVGVMVSGFTATPNASSGAVLSANTSYSIFIRSNCDIDGVSIYLGPLGFTTNTNLPPTNDFCAGAISIIEETSIADAASATHQLQEHYWRSRNRCKCRVVQWNNRKCKRRCLVFFFISNY